jgi:hypothetical protein
MTKYNEDLKWLRGANRWNNGATRFANKYLLRVIVGQQKIYGNGRVNTKAIEERISAFDRVNT